MKELFYLTGAESTEPTDSDLLALARLKGWSAADLLAEFGTVAVVPVVPVVLIEPQTGHSAILGAVGTQNVSNHPELI